MPVNYSCESCRLLSSSALLKIIGMFRANACPPCTWGYGDIGLGIMHVATISLTQLLVTRNKCYIAIAWKVEG